MLTDEQLKDIAADVLINDDPFNDEIWERVADQLPDYENTPDEEFERLSEKVRGYISTARITIEWPDDVLP